MITSIARTYWKICFTVHPSMFKWSTEYMIESYCPVMMSDQKKRKMFMSSMCQHLGCHQSRVDLSHLRLKWQAIRNNWRHRLSRPVFFLLANWSMCLVQKCHLTHCPRSYSLGEINGFRVIFLSLMVLASQGHSPPGIVLLQHISMQCNIEIETIETISINTISRVKHIR